MNLVHVDDSKIIISFYLNFSFNLKLEKIDQIDATLKKAMKHKTK
jgi:hypothetical protein